MAMKLSFVIPTFNEAAQIRQTLLLLQPLRAEGHEIILSDGGSEDETLSLATPMVDHLIHAPKGRARQMNAGATVASGEVLLFLHADTQLPHQAVQCITTALARNRCDWGRFDVRLSGSHPLLRLVEWMMNHRSRLSGIATGDQGIFIRTTLFRQVGGFPPLELMEDIALSRTLKQFSAPVCLKERVTTSSRRWEQRGIINTIALMWRIRLAYFLGANPATLARRYQKN